MSSERKAFEDTKIVVGLPYSSDSVSLKFVQSLTNLERTPNITLSWLGHTITSAARNMIVMNALKNGADYVFFLDTDMEVPRDIIYRLWKHDKDIASGIYQSRRGGGSFFVFIYDKMTKMFSNIKMIKWNEPLIKCDGVGTGCVLIKCDVFNKIERPWFFYNDASSYNLEAMQKLVDESKTNGLFGIKFADDFASPDKWNNGYGRGEDLNFFMKCVEAGIYCYVDTSLICGHIGMYSYGAGMQLMLPQQEKESASE